MTMVDHIPRSAQMSENRAERWLAAALAEASALREYDGQLYPLTDDPADMQVAEEIHAAWKDWAHGARQLLKKLPRPEEVEGSAYRELQVAVAHAENVLHFTPAEMLGRYKRMKAGGGKTYQSIAELRHELGLAPRG